MNMKWTESQKQAIENKGADILVSAGAGAGKTAVLTERIISRVCSDETIDINRFLIVTFTSAAASEMRGRISAAISKRLEEDPFNRHLQRQLTLIHKADISTIHSFCLNLIKNNFHLLDIEPDFKVGSTTEIDLLKKRVITDVCEIMLEGEEKESFSMLLDLFIRGNDETTAFDVFLKIYEYIRNFAEPLLWLNDKCEMYRGDTKVWENEIVSDFSALLDSLITSLKESIINAEGIIDFYIVTMEKDLEVLKNLQAAVPNGFRELYNACLSIKFDRIASAPKNCYCKEIDEYKAFRESMKDSVIKFKDEIAVYSEAAVMEGLRKAYPVMRTLYETIKLFDEKFTEAKKEEGILDFSDFEHFALTLLNRQEEDVLKSLQNKYVEIYVDEYQDCNSIQEEIFSKICGENTGIFMVGDVKQSIYRFRQGDPTIFIGKEQLFKDDKSGKTIYLNENFRSRKEIIETVNHIFKKIMSSLVGEIEYTEGHSLVFGADYTDQAGNVELLIADTDMEEDASEYEEDGEYSGEKEELIIDGTAKAEALMTANKIMSIINSKNQVYDKNINGLRDVKYSDIVILMRSITADAEVFEETLLEANIPCYKEKQSTLFMTFEIRLLLSFLKIADNPLQDIPLIGVLRSPLFLFNEDELIKIKLFKCEYFYNSIFAYINGGEDDNLKEKCKSFVMLLDNLRAAQSAMATDVFIDFLLRKTDFITMLCALPMANQRIANVNLLKGYAREFEQGGFKGLFSFIVYYESIEKQSEVSAARLMSENSNVVRIMTIHKSKGLEFPVVFLCQSAKKINHRNLSEPVLLHKNLGVSMKYIDKEKRIKYALLPLTAAKRRLKSENMSDEIRILYVALTRAKERLYITAVKKNAFEKQESLYKSAERDKIPKYEVLSAKSFFDLICLCIDKHIKVSIYGTNMLSQNINAVYEGTQISGDISLEKIKERLSFKYPFSELSKIPGKISVSELKQRMEYQTELERVNVKPPKFTDEKSAFTGADIGTLYHLVLKHVDLKGEDNFKSVQDCLAFLKNKFLISAEEEKLINPENIVNFLKSPLGKRMKNANKIFREQPFNMSVPAGELPGYEKNIKDTVLVQGIIDCLFEDENGLVLIDYKTDRNKTDDEFKEKYKGQIYYYRLAAKKMCGKKVSESYIYSITDKRVIEFEDSDV